MSFVAVDLGASQGRVIRGSLEGDRLACEVVARFPNPPVALDDGLHWDLPGLFERVVDGLHVAARGGPVSSVAVDSWGVDYGLLDHEGRLMGLPRHYRDPRHELARREVFARLDEAALFARTGIASLPFATIFQLVGDLRAGGLEGAASALLVADLVSFWLTAEPGTERTNASTTGLMRAGGDDFDDELFGILGLPNLFPPLRSTGEPIGTLSDDVARRCGLGSATVVRAVASHDTASAVVAVPATERDFAYISSGTWSLVGVEVDHPILSEDARRAGFTNERSAAGRVRFLRNVAGLWLLQESVRQWSAEGLGVSVTALVDSAASVPAGRWLIDPDLPELADAGDMPARIKAACRRAGGSAPETPDEVTRCVLDSLALAHRMAIRRAAALSDTKPEVVHIVGGGADNALLCQLTADASGLPVIAGPVEATAIGNLIVQAAGVGALDDDPASWRAVARASARTRRFAPSGTRRWEEAERRLAGRGAPARSG